jgi:protein-disulfide isomerase
MLGMRHARAAGRRRQREAESLTSGATAAGPDELLANVETQRRLSEALLALAEPYRTAVVLRYYEELSAAEIARRTGVPAGTVRWRVKEGVDRLRRQLDDRAGGRRASSLALIKFAAPSARALHRISIAVAMASVTAVAVVAVVHRARAVPAKSPAAVVSNGAHPRKESEMINRIGVVAVAATLAQPVPAAPAAAAIPISKAPRFWVPLGVGPIKGPPTAKVTIVAFMDYQSPFCKQASQTMDALLAAHPRDVRYQVIHRPLPFHRQAPFAAKAALAAGQQGKFWEMHETLLANQNALEPTDIAGYAKKLGLDVARFEADLTGPTVTNQADLEEANAQSLKVAAIPTFFFNGRSVPGAQPREVLEKTLGEELAYADAVLKSGARPTDLYNAIIKGGSTELQAGPSPETGPGADPLSPQALAARKVLTDNAAKATSCYEEALAVKPGLAGSVVVELRLAGGKEPMVLLHDSTMKFAKVDNCIVQSLKKLSYPKLDARDRLVVRHTFTFPQ